MNRKQRIEAVNKHIERLFVDNPVATVNYLAEILISRSSLHIETAGLRPAKALFYNIEIHSFRKITIHHYRHSADFTFPKV